MRTGRPRKNSKISTKSLKDTCRRILAVEKITEKDKFSVTIFDEEITIGEEDCRDLTLILYNAYERRHNENRFSLCREATLRAKLSNVLEYQINRSVGSKLKPHQISHLVRMYKQLHSVAETKLNPDYSTVRSILLEILPDITEREMYYLMLKHSPEHPIEEREKDMASYIRRAELNGYEIDCSIRETHVTRELQKLKDIAFPKELTEEEKLEHEKAKRKKEEELNRIVYDRYKERHMLADYYRSYTWTPAEDLAANQAKYHFKIPKEESSPPSLQGGDITR